MSGVFRSCSGASALIILYSMLGACKNMHKAEMLPNQADFIEEFRKQIKPKIYPNTSHVLDFIRDDFYILQWLKGYNFNVQTASHQIMDHLKWRESEKIDNIHLENWDYFKAEYPQFLNFGSNNSDIIGEVWLSDWDLRKSVLVGRTKLLVRWEVHLMEMAQRKLCERRLNASALNGHTHVKGVEIVDIAGFNNLQHGCISCKFSNL